MMRGVILIAAVVFAASCGDDGGTSDGSTGVNPTTTAADSSSGSSGSGSETTSTIDEGPYPNCAGAGMCDADFDLCAGDGSIGFCTSECQMASDCDEGTDGDAVPTCGSYPGVTDNAICFLDCSRGETCPELLDCVEVAVSISVCTWSP